MVNKHHVEGYANFVEYIEKFKEDDSVIIYFSGKKLPSGESWCDDCVRAWPTIERSLSKLDADSHFVYVEVGDRAIWKDMNCPFRKDPKLRLMQLPTLVKWSTPQKLEGDQCENPDLIDLLFSQEDY